MEWVETTAKTLDEAKELALDRLGVAADDAEFEILEEPRAGLFGRVRGEARVRARVMPTAVRPKQDRRSRGRQRDAKVATKGNVAAGRSTREQDDAGIDPDIDAGIDAGEDETAAEHRAEGPKDAKRERPRHRPDSKQKEQQVSNDDVEAPTVTPAEVGAAAESFMSGLTKAFGATATISVEVDGSDIEVKVDGPGLGLLVGHGGRTLTAVQDLVRVASQRRLGDHETRLRVDVGGYREKRSAALARFAVTVAQEVVESGTSKALEPMQSADRKVVHDALAGVDGVTSRSEGDDPVRRVVISPA